ncbi:spore coat protein U domain-containing protein [Polaromonas sp. YR568]|uniref:Csu type fimbrial protein n=1 Tax=Polaromonas sp. YR568 TaxID=1855301 RepID=UPI00398C0147
MPLMTPAFFAPRRLYGALLAAACALLLQLLPAAPAAAQSCYIGNAGSIALGTVSPDANTDTQNNLPYTCQSNANTTYFRVCMFIPEGAPIPGVNPRRMTNYNGAEMQYDLYSDAARTQIIGPPPNGNGFPLYTFTAVVPGGYTQQQNTAPIYARVPAGQSLPAGNAFQAQIGGGTIYWSWSNAGYPANCNSGAGGTGNATFYQGVTASVSNACRITLATDLDFGNTGALTVAREQTSTIMVRCPTGTTWRLGLSNGSNAVGTVRRMRNAAGNYVTYELYRDSVRTQRWGNAVGTDTSSGTGQGESTPVAQSVYGRVPAQPGTRTGAYSDTITVTLTY